MNLPVWLDGMTDSLQLAMWQQFGLAFLLGSIAVATWSDLKRLSAQREFVEIWLLFVFAILALDIYHVYHGHASGQTAAIKWGLITTFSLLSLRQIGILFALAAADVAALAAAACLFAPVLVILYYAVAKLIAMGIGPWLARGRPVWQRKDVASMDSEDRTTDPAPNTEPAARCYFAGVYQIGEVYARCWATIGILGSSLMEKRLAS